MKSFLTVLALSSLLGCGGGVTIDTGAGGASGGTGGAKGTASTTASSTSGTTSSTASTTSSTTSSSSGGTTCPMCGVGTTCCEGACVNKEDDFLNCGSCGNKCPGPNPYCANGACATPPCSTLSCTAAESCCGSECCSAGTLCCNVPEGVSIGPKCTAPVDGTCPIGCPACL